MDPDPCSLRDGAATVARARETQISTACGSESRRRQLQLRVLLVPPPGSEAAGAARGFNTTAPFPSDNCRCVLRRSLRSCWRDAFPDRDSGAAGPHTHCMLCPTLYTPASRRVRTTPTFCEAPGADRITLRTHKEDARGLPAGPLVGSGRRPEVGGPRFYSRVRRRAACWRPSRNVGDWHVPATSPNVVGSSALRVLNSPKGRFPRASLSPGRSAEAPGGSVLGSPPFSVPRAVPRGQASERILRDSARDPWFLSKSTQRQGRGYCGHIASAPLEASAGVAARGSAWVAMPCSYIIGARFT